jgi:molecular chaperone GrpE (heat shock protein)
MVYEQRISELEKELDTKDEINRELIQAEIQNIKRQMDAERVRSESGLN